MVNIGSNLAYIENILKKSDLHKDNLNPTVENGLGAVNSIFTLTQEGQTSDQKAEASYNIIEKAISFLGSILGGNGEARAADKKIQKQTKKIEKLNNKSKTLGIELNGSFEKISSDIKRNQKILEDAQKLLIETEKQIKEEEEKIAEKVEQIGETQKELANEEDPEKQEELLNEIKGYIKDISGFKATLKEFETQLKTLQEATNTSAENVDEAAENMVIVEENGIAEIQSVSAETIEASQELTKTGQEGAVHNVNGATLAAKAQVYKLNPVTAALSIKLEMASGDQLQAGAAKISGIAANAPVLLEAATHTNLSQGIIQQFNNTIGSALNEYITGFGAWHESFSPVLEGLGTLCKDLTEEGALGQLVSSVDEDLAKIKGEKPAEKPENKPENKPGDKQVTPAGTQNTSTEGTTQTKATSPTSGDTENKSGLKTPNVSLESLPKKENK